MPPPSAEDLKRLPLRGIVAYAVRWAERVRPALTLSGPALTDEQVAAVDAAIAAARNFAEGTEPPPTPQDAMAMAHEAGAMAGAAVHAAGAEHGSQVRYAARTAYLAAETLAQALCAFAPASPVEADDILEPGNPLEWIIDMAATMAHSAGYSGRFVLAEAGIEDTAADDYSALLEQCAGQGDRVGDPLKVASLGPLWRDAPGEWMSAAGDL